jgi:hypothetical protein
MPFPKGVLGGLLQQNMLSVVVGLRVQKHAFELLPLLAPPNLNPFKAQ